MSLLMVEFNPMIPHTIGRYEIKKEIGRGGMATVYLAHDPKFKRDIALKVLPREFLHDPTFHARFEREAHAIATLEHPAIVPVYDIGEDQGQPFLVMRLLQGGTLTNRLKKGLLDTLEIAKILGRLAPALDEAHRKGIIHRDLKPDNILFDQRRDPFITDFGIAKITEHSETLTSGSVVIGTPAYLSPEQANGETLDGRSDIYSFGIILFEMLTGQLPYQSSTPIGLIMKHISEPIPNLLKAKPDLPPDCQAIVNKALAKDRNERFSTAKALAEAFAEAVNPDFVPFPDMNSIFDTPPDERPVPQTTRLGASPPPPPATPQQPVSPQPLVCPRCKVTNAPNSRICMHCSQRLQIDCVRCFTGNAFNAKRCIKCGAELQFQRARRRQSTQARQQAVAERAKSFQHKEARKIRDKLQQVVNDLVVRSRRAEALSMLEQLDERTLNILRDNLLTDNDPYSRYLTAKVMGQLCSRSELKVSIRRHALQALIDAINDSDPQVRQQVQEALQKIGRRTREVTDLFSGLLDWMTGD
ncbi:MAG: protein kinase [Anaerolineae bacterium]|nr:protein kinase [Anaerolineae bacterium]